MTVTDPRMLFIVFICLITLIRLWLAGRQIWHVGLYRTRPPSEFSGFISIEAYQKAADYTIAKTKFAIGQLIVTAVMTLWLTVGGGLNWLYRVWGIMPDTSLAVQSILLFGSVFCLTGIIDSIFDYYRVFGIETRFGFNRSSLQTWITDQIRSTLLSIVLGLPLLFAAVYFMNWAPTTWWVWVWIVLIGFNIAMAAIYPKFIAPLFNRFEPLEDDVLRQRIQTLLHQNRFQSDGLFVMDGSRRSAHGNAYFTGFGPTKRIVFFDTLLTHLSHDEIIAVLAHELGHLRKKHIWQQMGLLAILSFIFLWLLSWLAQSPLFYTATDVDYPTIPMTLLLFMQVVPFLLFPLTPLFSAISRKNEFEADRFAADQVPASDLINALLKLFKENASTLTPDPLYSAVYDSHPSALTRIRRLEEE